MSINFVHTSKGETDRVNGNKKLNQNYMKKVEDLKQHVNNYSLGKIHLVLMNLSGLKN